MKTFKQRASDSLDLTVVVEIGLERLKAICKKSVLYSVKSHVERMQRAKSSLEDELKILLAGSCGFFSSIRRGGLIKKLKREIAEINMQIVQWINSLYRRYVV